jgi:hypothetical protein
MNADFRRGEILDILCLGLPIFSVFFDAGVNHFRWPWPAFGELVFVVGFV